MMTKLKREALIAGGLAVAILAGGAVGWTKYSERRALEAYKASEQRKADDRRAAGMADSQRWLEKELPAKMAKQDAETKAIEAETDRRLAEIKKK